MKRLIPLLVVLLFVGVAVAAADESEIGRINRQINDASADWVAGNTSVSNLSVDEKAVLTYHGCLQCSSKGVVFAAPDGLQHESSYDCRDEGLVTSIKNQGGRCGSCWAFATIALVESAFLKYAGLWTDLSEQHIISDCSSAGSCDGGWPDWALDYIRGTGVSTEACYPYEEADSGCEPCVNWTAYKITDHTYVEPTENDFKFALKEMGPLVVVLNVPYDWYYYRSGVYRPVSGLGWANHAVLLVGWDDADGCWFIKNSWGARWGEDGYGRVKYGTLEKYNYAYGVTGVEDIGVCPVVGWHKPWAVRASTNYSSHYRAERSIDGDLGTHWFSEYCEVSPQITFSLLDPVLVSKVRVTSFERYLPLSITVETSEGRGNWRQVASHELTTATEEILFSPVMCRYVRLTYSDTGRDYGTCTEFDVWVSEEEEEEEEIPSPHNYTLTITTGDSVEVIVLPGDLVSILLAGNQTILEWWANP